ncbi:unnamed protein product [Arctia plantaginis]|uniref:Major facilitator superfamily (MFS) profile domain-containing protein n=1 Tax=Arctia plantaginis TaxID=874455 RepID=A0A8S0Z8K2_ARCPL|nr:unnamed protein product [Arctia plantaginis]
MMFPMGLLCQRYGGKLPLQIALFVNGIVSIATPWLTVWGDWKALCACRILQGLSQAGTYPCIQSVLGKWVPINERATLGCCVHTGLTIGTVIAFQLAGFLGSSKWGWPSIFYATGVICLLCFILITIFGASNPSEHKSVTEKEKNYIKGSFIDNNDKSGILSSLPYVAGFFTMLLFGWLSDYSTNNKIINYIDLAPDFSGTLTAIGNTLANIFNLITPAIISYIVTDMTNITQWRLLFFITSGVALIANTVFVILVSTDVQPWNYGEQKESCDEVKKENIKETHTIVTTL